MKILEIKEHKILLDDEDYERVIKYKWQVNKFGYVQRDYSVATIRKNMMLQRFILNIGKGLGGTVDHINHNKLDNQKANLRYCSHSDNGFNSSKGTLGCISKYKGVTYNKSIKKFSSKIMRNYVQVNLWLSEVEIECAYAYDFAVKLLNIKHAYINNVNIENFSIKSLIEYRVKEQLKRYKLI